MPHLHCYPEPLIMLSYLFVPFCIGFPILLRNLGIFSLKLRQLHFVVHLHLVPVLLLLLFHLTCLLLKPLPELRMNLLGSLPLPCKHPLFHLLSLLFHECHSLLRFLLLLLLRHLRGLSISLRLIYHCHHYFLLFLLLA